MGTSTNFLRKVVETASAAPGNPSPLVNCHGSTGWWCNTHFEKYEFVNGKDDIPYMKWKI